MIRSGAWIGLEQENAEPPYTEADLERDRATLQNLLP